jgi:uncharacterized OB-fold protein
MSETSDLPVPVPSPETKPFWDAAREDRFVIPRCESCGHTWFPPSLACPSCGAEHPSWVAASGRGRVFSFVVYHRVYHRAFKSRVPYVVAVIELEEGPRMIANVVGVAPEKVRCDMPVTVVFEPRRDGIKVPQFVPAQS